MLNPVHLRTLVTVVRTGSFADAGRELGYTGSAVSQQIAALERAVRVPLFERQAHSVRPTPAAVVLAGRAREAIAALRGLEEDVLEAATGRRGTLRVGSFATASERLLPYAFRTLQHQHPEVHVHLDEAEIDVLGQLLLEGDLDLALVYDYDLVPSAAGPGVCRVPLIDEELLLLLPLGDPLADQDDVRLTDLVERTWVTTRPGTPGAECLERICATAGFAPVVGFRTNNYDVVRELVRGGLGIAMVPALGHRPVPGVLTRPLPDRPRHRHVHVLHRAPEPGPTARAFLAALHGAAERISGNYLHLPEGVAP